MTPELAPTAATTDPARGPDGTQTVDPDQLTRAQKALLALTGDVARQLAEDHGVCVRPLAMRRIDLTTGRVEVVPVPCGSRREDLCPPCADKHRRLRMTQCREGWHLDAEPVPAHRAPTAAQKADAHRPGRAARRLPVRPRHDDDQDECEAIRETVAVVDDQLRRMGVTGRLAPLDGERRVRKRSTRRRQDAPNLPRRSVEHRTVGRTYAGRYRPSTFLTLTLDTYGRVDADGAALDPDSYDYRRAARDAIHFPKIVDRFWQNTRRCVGWEVQYFGTIEPQRRGAPHFHAAVRGTIPRAELRAITAATYHQVWWPNHDDIRYTGDRPCRGWDDRHARVSSTPTPASALPTWDEATDPDVLTRPAHTVRFGPQVHVKGVLGGTEEAGRHIGYLTKYLTKDVAKAAGLDEDASDRLREHHRRLVAELAVTPCSPRCGVWLLYGIQPKGARLSTEARDMQGQGPQAPTPRHRRAPRARVAQVVGQDAHRPRPGTRRVRSATARHVPTSAPASPSTTGPTSGRRPAPATPTCRRGPRCCWPRSPNDNAGKPTTPQPKCWRAPHPIVRQPGGSVTDKVDRDELLTVRQVIELLGGVSRDTFYEWRRSTRPRRASGSRTAICGCVGEICSTGSKACVTAPSVLHDRAVDDLPRQHLEHRPAPVPPPLWGAVEDRLSRALGVVPDEGTRGVVPLRADAGTAGRRGV